MRLYKIWQQFNIGWDTYKGAVVAAESADEAIKMHPDNSGQTYESTLEYPGPERDHWADSWTSPCHVQVMYIGEAVEGIPKGVILADYRAG